MARLLRLEIRRSTGAWLFPLVLVAIWYISTQGRADGVWLWPDASLSIQSTIALVGPLAAGLAAWTAARNRRGIVQELLAITPRSALSRDLASWVATTFWFVLAYVLAASFVYLQGYLGGAWGSPVLWPVVVGFLSIVTNSALGYAAGYYLPSTAIAPIAATVIFLLQFAPIYLNGPAHHLTPLGEGLTRSVFHGVLPNLFIGQTLWLLGLTGAALAAIAIKQRPGRVLSFGLMISPAIVAALGAVLLLNTSPWATPKQMAAATVPYNEVCAKRHIPVCVHPAYESLLPETATVVGEVVKPLVGIPGAPTRAAQINSIFSAPPSEEELTFYLYDKNSLGNELAFQISNELVGQETATMFDEEGADPNDARLAIQAWLLRQADRNSEAATFGSRDPEAVAAASERFAELTPEERDKWLRDNYVDLIAGKVTLEDLP